MSESIVKSEKKINSKKRIAIISDTHISKFGAAFNLNAFNKGIEKINKIKR